MKLFLHICCGPCALYPLEILSGEGVSVTGFFYNPNIHPLPEYLKRRAGALQAARHFGVACVIRDEESARVFFRAVHGREEPGREGRCGVCQEMRLERTAREAAARGADAFSSTLLYSRHQDHEHIRETGMRLERETGVPFLYRDFRAGWQRGIDLSRALGIYRQSWCGCAYSIEDRYARDFALAREHVPGI